MQDQTPSTREHCRGLKAAEARLNDTRPLPTSVTRIRHGALGVNCARVRLLDRGSCEPQCLQALTAAAR